MSAIVISAMFTDFSTLDADSAHGSLHPVDTGSAVDISEVYVVSIFSVHPEDGSSIYLRNV
jgi:hypothetical protein